MFSPLAAVTILLQDVWMEREQLNAYALPDSPGVYIFRDSRGKPLYVGKAASLRDRVRSYFARDLAASRSPAVAGMVGKAKKLTWHDTESVLEALILEANLIKKYQPPYNTDQKDNKSFNYLVVTKEDFPRVLVVRGRELAQSWNQSDIKKVFGPYPQGGSLKEALRIVRKILPFRDKCLPGAGKPCFNAQIGLCPGVCAGTMTKKEYAQSVRHIELLFSGKLPALRKQIEKEMKELVRAEKFEEASVYKRRLEALNHIRDVSLIKNEHRVALGGAVSSNTVRIEAYDVAHTAGTETVGVMTVVEDGETNRAQYRMFKIQSARNDDTAALSEILSRRLAHPEWRMPHLIVIDGGRGQVNAAQRVLQTAGVSIPLVGVVKDDRHKPERLIGHEKSIRAYEREILLANSEAHRFAIQYHRKRRHARLV